MEGVKVSILVPVYGVEKFIKQCAESLFEQSYANIEYVFVDDCTVDNSIAILQQVLCDYPNRKSQVKIIRHPINRGLGAGRKTALAASTGNFVLNVDSDDYLMPDAVETLVRAQQTTGADIVTGAYLALFPDGSMAEKRYQGFCKEETLKLLLIQNTLLPHIWARLIRRTIYTDHNINAVENINMAEDYALTPRLVFAARHITYADKAVYVYRQNSPSSIFGHFSHQHVISILRANETIWQYIQTHDSQYEYTFALGIGMLNAWHTALKNGLSLLEIKSICHYVPKSTLFRLVHLLFAHRATLPLLRFSYLSIKWCYKRWLRYPD